jgi:conjugative relaxase-like TrwC/TraI family protein
MLRINAITSVAHAKDYFKQHLVQGDYYAKGQDRDVISNWNGKAAQRMGLSGEVTQEEFSSLAEHRNPVTGDPLTERKKDNRRIGYDFTFSAPKSISVYYARTGDQRVVNAFREAVQETMQEMESEIKVRDRQNGKQDGSRVTGNGLWAGFLHHESRPVEGKPDPFLHEHVVIQNVTWDSEHKNKNGTRGSWMAADVSDIKRDAPLHQAKFDARLAGKMQELGLSVRQTDFSFDLAGFNDEINQTFSRRTALIEKRAKELGVSRTEDKAGLGAKTRESKLENVTREEMIAEWNSRLGDRQWEAFISQAQSGGSGPRITADEAIEYGLNHSLERQSVVRKNEVLAVALHRGVSISPQEIEAAFSHRSDVIVAREEGHTLVTTQKVLQEEKKMVRWASEGRGAASPLGSDAFEFKPITRGDGESFELNEQQQAAVRHVLGSRSKVMIVRGAAGVGKTSMTSEAIRGIEDHGRKVHAFAPTTGAAQVLQKDGAEADIPSLKNTNTVAKLLQSEQMQAETRGQVILIDEAGLMSTPDMKRVFEIAERNDARIVLSGDFRQHSSVQRGDALRTLVEQAGIRPAEITQIQRQRKAAYREAVQDLATGSRADVIRGFDTLDNLGMVEEIRDREQRNERLAKGYVDALKQGKSALVVSPTNAEGAEVHAQIRERLKQQGMIGGQDHEFLRLRNLHLTEEEKTNQALYKADQIIEFHKPSKAVGATYGSRVTVVGHDKDRVQVKTSFGDVVELPLKESRKFSVYQRGSMQVSKGDSIRLTKNIYLKQDKRSSRKHRLENGAIYQVDGITDDGKIRLHNGWLVPGEVGHISSGHVTTSYSAQGKTRDVVFLSESSASFGAASREQFYVSSSRAKEATVIVTDDKQALRNTAILRSSERMAAMDLASISNGQSTSVKSEKQREIIRRTFVDRLRSAGTRARAMARRKAELIKASFEQARTQWRDRVSRGIER